MGRQAGEVRLLGRGAGHHEEQINCHAAIPQTSPRGTTPTTGRTNGYEDAPTGMLQVAHEFEFLRFRFDYELQKADSEQVRKIYISKIISIRYKDFIADGIGLVNLSGRKAFMCDP